MCSPAHLLIVHTHSANKVYATEDLRQSTKVKLSEGLPATYYQVNLLSRYTQKGLRVTPWWYVACCTLVFSKTNIRKKPTVPGRTTIRIPTCGRPPPVGILKKIQSFSSRVQLQTDSSRSVGAWSIRRQPLQGIIIQQQPRRLPWSPQLFPRAPIIARWARKIQVGRMCQWKKTQQNSLFQLSWRLLLKLSG